MPTCQITVYWHEICKEGLLATGCVGARITAGGIIAGVRWNAPGQHPLQPLALQTANQATQNKKRRDRIKKAGRKKLPTSFKLKDSIFDSPKNTHRIAKIYRKSVPDRVSAKLSNRTWESMIGRITSCTATKHRGYRQEFPGDTTFRWLGQEISFASRKGCEIQFCLIVLLKKDYCARPRPEKAIHPQHAGLTQSL